MAKRTQKTKQVTAFETSIELNRWCIEMAVKWPTRSLGGYGAAMAAQGFAPRTEDEDVIGRANKIMAWVKTQH